MAKAPVGHVAVQHPSSASQNLICVDYSGRETERIIDRKTAHTSPGIRHLAIQIVVFDSDNEIILHERPFEKVGGGVLDAPTTHVLQGETPVQAAHRCLKNEYGIAKAEISIVGGFAYEKDYGNGSCENEFCLAAFALYDGKIIPDKQEVVRIVRLPATEVVQELVMRPENFPPWLKGTMGLVKADILGRRFFV